MGINVTWTLRGGEVFTPAPFGVMGIVNITPDSFYDGNTYHSQDNTLNLGLAHAIKLWEEGAHILDIGGESSRPGATPLDSHTELQRIMPVLVPLLQKCHTAAIEGQRFPYISVDTYHAKTAATALEAGVHIINDISACLYEPELVDVVSAYKPGYVLMHCKGTPKTMQEHIYYDNIIDEICSFFEQRINILVRAGLPEEHIVLDPGIGFGKNIEHNITILQNLQKLKSFGRPILMALSMKSLIQGLLQPHLLNNEEKAQGTQIITALLAQQEIFLHRVHHVQQTLQTLQIVHSLTSPCTTRCGS